MSTYHLALPRVLEGGPANQWPQSINSWTSAESASGWPPQRTMAFSHIPLSFPKQPLPGVWPARLFCLCFPSLTLLVPHDGDHLLLSGLLCSSLQDTINKNPFPVGARDREETKGDPAVGLLLSIRH